MVYHKRRARGCSQPWTSEQVLATCGEIGFTALTYALFGVYVEGATLVIPLVIYTIPVVLLFVCWGYCVLLDPALSGGVAMPCMKLTQERERYCRLCGKVIPGLDHHCNWLNTCVGKRNYWAFFTLATCGLIQHLLEIALGITTAVRWAEGDAGGIAFGVVVAVAGCVGVGAFGSLWVFHVFLLYKGLGTYDWLLHRDSLATSSPAVPPSVGVSVTKTSRPAGRVDSPATTTETELATAASAAIDAHPHLYGSETGDVLGTGVIPAGSSVPYHVDLSEADKADLDRQWNLMLELKRRNEAEETEGAEAAPVSVPPLPAAELASHMLPQRAETAQVPVPGDTTGPRNVASNESVAGKEHERHGAHVDSTAASSTERTETRTSLTGTAAHNASIPALADEVVLEVPPQHTHSSGGACLPRGEGESHAAHRVVASSDTGPYLHAIVHAAAEVVLSSHGIADPEVTVSPTGNESKFDASYYEGKRADMEAETPPHS